MNMIIREFMVFEGQPQISNVDALITIYQRNFIFLILPIFDPFFKVVCLLFSLLVIVDVLKVIG